MPDENMTREQLVEEINELRRRNADLEARDLAHKSLSDALKQSGAKFRKLTEKAVVGVYLIQDGSFKYVNPCMAKIFGYEVEELQGVAGPNKLVHPEDWPAVEEHLRRRIAGLVDVVNVQFKGLKKDGEVIHVEVFGSRIEDDGGPAVIGTLTDITERIRARLDREAELKKFQALYDLATAMTTEHSLEENLSLVVDKSKDLLGADAAYLALRDEAANELYFHTLSGIRTEAFKSIRVPLGSGLGGKVAQEGKFLIVEDYFQEIEPTFHGIMAEEGLLSGIGVPVQTGNTNLGVLYVFNRSHTSFSRSHLDTLSLFGNLAAVEIRRKRAEEGLRESQDRLTNLYGQSKRREELYLSLLNSSADAIVIYDMEGRAQYVSPSFTRIFGWSLPQVEGKRIPFVPDSERTATMAVIEGIIREGKSRSAFETKRFTKDGRLLDISISSSRYHDQEGNPAGILVSLRDITDRKRAEDALRSSGENYRELYAEAERRGNLYRTLLDASPEPIVVYDMDGIPTFANPAFTKVFGWTFQELSGKRIDFVPEENWPETLEMIDKVVKGENFSDRETRRYTKDGRVISVSVSGAAFLDSNGKPTGSVVHLRDITARKEAEANLAAELKKFRALYDLALAMSSEHDLDENLALLVEKSRDLLGADKSFLALRDETAGDLYMHTLSGIDTEEFKRLRIPMGVGLGGKVASEGKFHIVEDYFAEVGPIFHDIVRSEGLLSGIAVPVQTGKTNVGVLYAFNRQKTPFLKSDPDTLSLLGNLAAVEITRRRALERLQQSQDSYRQLYEASTRREELYLSLLNSSADAIVVYDMDGRTQYVNSSFTKIFGWTIEEMEGRRIPFMPESEAEASMSRILDLIQTGNPVAGYETRRYTKDGRLLDISISASRYRDHEGNPAGMLSILRDISDRKAAETALKESEVRFRTLAEVAPIGLVVMASDGKVEYINAKFSDIFGYTVEDLPDLAAWFRSAYPTEQARQKAAAIWDDETAEMKVEYGIGKEARPRIFRVRCKDGEIKMASFRAVVLAGKGIIATFLDVTAEVKAQQEIIRAKNEWERTFNSVSDLIVILDDRSRIVRANRALAERLGVVQERLIGMNCAERDASGRLLGALCPETSILYDGREHSAEVADEVLGGVFDLRTSPLWGDDGKLLGSVNVARDITAFKSLERARRLAVHHLSHELKTPLTIIKASVKDLESETLAPEMRARKMERIQRGLFRLSEIQRIVQEIVAPHEYRPRPFELEPAVHEILDDLHSLSGYREVALVPKITLAHTDIIDPAMFGEILRTLVKNAIENSPDQSEVVVSVSEAPSGVLLQVADRGVGVTGGDREYLFDAFHHTQETDLYTTKKPFDFNAGGKGLELMRIKMMSEEGSFDIYFETERCKYLQTPTDRCPGRISLCPHVADVEGCKQSGGTTFSVVFRRGNDNGSGNNV